MAALVDHQIKTFALGFNKISCLGNIQCMPDLFIGSIFLAPAHIVTERSLKEDSSLRYYTDGMS